ncbi:MAG: hypothetical protein JSS95_09220 [Acidobacteria bacterium]|nr:hypothetical protein [Acidobacteriota bacterium]
MARSKNSDAQQPPSIGDKVTIGNSDSVYTIITISPNGSTVGLQLEDTNLERFRVPVSDLKFVDRRAAQPARPPAPVRKRLPVEEIRERLATTQTSALDHLAGEIAILKKYLKTKDAPEQALGQLDDLVESEEKRWQLTIAAIESLLVEDEE